MRTGCPRREQHGGDPVEERHGVADGMGSGAQTALDVDDDERIGDRAGGGLAHADESAQTSGPILRGRRTNDYPEGGDDDDR